MSVLTPAATAAVPISGPPLLTAEEFVHKYADRHAELVHGVVKELPMPDNLHGYTCMELAFYLRLFCGEADFGRVMVNDPFLAVGRDPDTVRGPDIAVYSYARMPKGPVARGLLDVMPEVVVEVKSPTNRWNELIIKAGEYLAAGISAVLLVDDEARTIRIYGLDSEPMTLQMTDTLTLPDVLPGFSLPLAKLFS